MPEDITAFNDYQNGFPIAPVQESFFNCSETEEEPEEQPIAVEAEWEDLSMSLTPVLECIQSGTCFS